VVEAFDDRFDLVADEVVERVQLMVRDEENRLESFKYMPMAHLQAPTSLQHQNVDTSS
jgi:hypothetical protein